MDARKAIEFNLDTAVMVVTRYLADLTEEELMHRPHPKANHIKWQLGHLIASDNQMVNRCCEDAIPTLPEGFVEKHSKPTSSEDAAGHFHSKEEYLSLYRSQTKAIKTTLSDLTVEELDRPTPEPMHQYAPTVGAALVLIGSHWMMHAGQWAVIRRQLGRDPLF